MSNLSSGVAATMLAITANSCSKLSLSRSCCNNCPSSSSKLRLLVILTIISSLYSFSHAQNLTSRKLIKSSSSLVNTAPFEPLVTAKCEKNLMQINVLTERAFNGLVHVRGFRRPPCQVFGDGNSTTTTLTIDIFAEPSSPNYCGVFKPKGSEERSVSLVIRLHKALELSDDKNFVITCGSTDFVNNKKRPQKLSFKFYDESGNRISRLYHGESYRLRAEVLSSHAVAPAANEPSETQSPAVPSTSHITTTPTNYHLFIKNCIIFNANDSDIEFIDDHGCPTIFGIEPFQQLEPNIAEAKIGSMFKLPTTNRLHVQCLVELIEGCRFCGDSLCSKNGTSRKERLLEQVDMSMLVSTTAYVFEPDQLMSASILGGAPISGRSNNGGSKECSEWRFPWLIALSIMLAIMLVIMMVINIFLCSSMSCNCFKPETVEVEPNFIEDYDPYKVDFGFYDSRLSLSRPYPFAGGNNNITTSATPTQFHVDSLLGHSHSPASTTASHLHHHHNVYN